MLRRLAAPSATSARQPLVAGAVAIADDEGFELDGGDRVEDVLCDAAKVVVVLGGAAAPAPAPAPAGVSARPSTPTLAKPRPAKAKAKVTAKAKAAEAAAEQCAADGAGEEAAPSRVTRGGKGKADTAAAEAAGGVRRGRLSLADLEERQMALALAASAAAVVERARPTGDRKRKAPGAGQRQAEERYVPSRIVGEGGGGAGKTYAVLWVGYEETEAPSHEPASTVESEAAFMEVLRAYRAGLGAAAAGPRDDSSSRASRELAKLASPRVLAEASSRAQSRAEQRQLEYVLAQSRLVTNNRATRAKAATAQLLAADTVVEADAEAEGRKRRPNATKRQRASRKLPAAAEAEVSRNLIQHNMGKRIKCAPSPARTLSARQTRASAARPPGLPPAPRRSRLDALTP